MSATIGSYSEPDAQRFYSVGPASGPTLYTAGTPSPVGSEGYNDAASVIKTSDAVSSMVLIEFIVSGKVKHSKFAGMLGLSAVYPFSAFATPVSVVLSQVRLGPIISVSGAV